MEHKYSNHVKTSPSFPSNEAKKLPTSPVARTTTYITDCSLAKFRSDSIGNFADCCDHAYLHACGISCVKGFVVTVASGEHAADRNKAEDMHLTWSFPHCIRLRLQMSAQWGKRHVLQIKWLQLETKKRTLHLTSLIENTVRSTDQVATLPLPLSEKSIRN